MSILLETEKERKWVETLMQGLGNAKKTNVELRAELATALSYGKMALEGVIQPPLPPVPTDIGLDDSRASM